MSSVVRVTKGNLSEVFGAGEKKVLVDFRAQWCGPCRMLEPVLEGIAGAHEDVVVASIDVDEFPEVAAQFGVDSIPALFLLEGGKVVRSAVGYRDQKALESLFGL